MRDFGADIVRLWAASSDYHADVRCSKEIFKQIGQNYLKFRNTCKFMLDNLVEFDPENPFSRKGSAIFPSEVHEHIDLGQAWEFFRGYATHDSADLYSRIELVERDWEDLSERVLARLELAERF